jgi:teichoic acid transport system permease protein
MGPYLAETWRRRPFIWHLARTQLKAENYDTVAGQLWIILNPILMAAVYLFVRTVFRPPKGDQRDVIDHLIMGVFLFKFISSGMMLGARSIYMNRNVVLNTAFPRAIFPIASTTQAFMELIPTMGVFLIVHWYTQQPFSPDALLWVPFYLVTLTIFCLGLALLFAPLCVLYRDVTSTVPYLTKVWLFMSPVMYSVAELQASSPELYNYVKYLNAAFGWYAAFEQIFDGQQPDTQWLFLTLFWMTVTFFAGAALFLLKERRFAARL